MAISFFSARDFGRVLKVTIQKTGRLGFSNETATAMELDCNTYILLGKDDDLKADLIMVKRKTPHEDAFQVKKSGEYYYLDTTALFDMLRYNYKTGSNIFFDVTRDNTLDDQVDGEAYLLTQRKSKGRRTAKQEPASKSSEQSLFPDSDQ